MFDEDGLGGVRCPKDTAEGGAPNISTVSVIYDFLRQILVVN
jgi:hypothetical protein